MTGLQAAQRDILTYAKWHPNSNAFHASLILTIKNINVLVFQKAIEAVTARHDALRSYISLSDLEPTQHVLPSERLRLAPLQHIDATGVSYTEPLALEQTLQKLGKAGILNDPFDLNQPPLWRAALVQFDETTYQFMLVAHHIIMDGTSFDILFNDISSYYNAFLHNNTPELPPVPPMDKHLTLEQPDSVKQERLAYWQKTLTNLNILRLPTDKPDSGSTTFTGMRHPFHMDAELNTTLKQAFPGQSINNLFLAALSVLCYRYTSGEATDICLGTTSANRRHNIPNINHLVHCLFNSLAIRLTFSRDTSFNALLLHVKEQMRNALQNQLSQTDIYQHALSSETKRGLHTASPFSIMFTASPYRPPLNLEGASASHPVEPHIGGHSRFADFGIYAEEQADQSQSCFLEYNTARYSEPAIKRMINHLMQIFNLVIKQPTIALKDIYLLQPNELRQIAAYNNTEQPLPFVTMPEALSAISKTLPHKTAMRLHHPTNAKRLTFAELEIHSTKLANYLLSLNYQPGQYIGMCLPRSIEMIITVFAVLKAGMVLVPLETQPNQKNLLDEKSKSLDAIITNQKKSALFPEKVLINLSDENAQRAIQASSDTPPKASLTPNSPAYVMYSSGTTGKPKGILISHGGLSNLFGDLKQKYPHDASEINTADATFDAAFFDWLLMLLGNTMHLIQKKNDRYSPLVLSRLIAKYKIDIIVTLPNILENLNHALPALTNVTSMGQKPKMADLSAWRNPPPQDDSAQPIPKRITRNGYGPTENTICTSLHTITDDMDAPSTLIGHPIANTKIFIIDRDNTLCPVNIPGQLVITGPGVALGYTNNPERNEQDFKTLKFDGSQQKLIPATPGEPGAMRCYFTGDLGCYYLDAHENPNIQFISRMGREVKTRGVTINLDVLEAALRNHPEIKDISIHANNETLLAFVIPKDLKQTLDEHTLRRSINQFLHAKTALPRIAYPSDVIIVSKFILNANGKIDIANLPYTEKNPSFQENLDGLSQLEMDILKLWSNILRIPIQNIDLEDSFYMNGGDSLIVIQLESLLNDHPHFKIEPPVTAAELLFGSIKSLTALLTPRCTPKASLLVQHSVFNQQTARDTTLPSLPADPTPPRDGPKLNN